MKMQDCPRYPTCSAPICPLDPDWQNRSHLPEDRVCIWLTELSKPGGLDLIATAIGDEAALLVDERRPAIAATSTAIRHRLDQASRTGSKLAAQRRAGRPSRGASEALAPTPGSGGSPA